MIRDSLVLDDQILTGSAHGLNIFLLKTVRSVDVRNIRNNKSYLELTYKTSKLLIALHNELSVGTKFIYERATYDEVAEQFPATDKLIEEYSLAILHSSIRHGAENQSQLKVAQELSSIRELYHHEGKENHAFKDLFRSSYLKVMSSLLTTYQNMIQVAHKDVVNNIIAAYSLEKAKMSAGNYQVFLFEILTSDEELSHETFQTLYDLKSHMDVLMDVKIVGLGGKAIENIDRLKKLDAWSRAQETFENVLRESNEGAFGVNSNIFFDEFSIVFHELDRVTNDQLQFTADKLSGTEKSLLRDQTVVYSTVCVLTVGLFLLIWLVIRSFTSPIRSLMGAVEKFSAGDFTHTIEIQFDDEFAILANAMNKMSNDLDNAFKDLRQYSTALKRTVEERTKELMIQKKSVDELINSAPVGIITIETDETIGKKFSPHSIRIFETNDIAKRTFDDLLLSHCSLSNDQKNQCIQAIRVILGTDRMNFEFNEERLAHELTITVNDKRKNLELTWTPIEDSEKIVKKILVCIMDVTKMRELQIDAMQKGENLSRIHNILECGEQFKDFLENLHALHDEIHPYFNDREEFVSNLPLIKRNIHTIKGNARQHNFKDLANAAHLLETNIKIFIDNTKRNERDLFSLKDCLNTICNVLREYYDIGKKANAINDEFLSVDAKAMATIFEDLHDEDKPNEEKISMIKLLCYGIYGKDFAKILNEKIKWCQSLAKKLGKDDINIVKSFEPTFIKKPYINIINDALGHLMRNAIDHGIENANIRALKNKPKHGSIFVEIDHHKNDFTFYFYDDGQGLDVRKLREKAHTDNTIENAQDLTLDEITNLIFAPGFSTHKEATNISGRGVGMDVVKENIEMLGGHIKTSLEPSSMNGDFVPFKFVITLPNYIKYDIQSVQKSASLEPLPYTHKPGA